MWGESGDPAANRAAVDAHYGDADDLRLLQERARAATRIDGQGEKLDSFVHVGSNYVNAFWDGEKMNYGDGDGRRPARSTTLDIAGHEITHGLTERTAGLIYSGESGGLNEAMSDIMGTGVEWYASQKNPGVKFDWAVGEDAWTPTNGDPNDALRYMNDPKKDNYSIDHYSDYPRQTEVHGSSGIANNAFYLLAKRRDEQDLRTDGGGRHRDGEEPEGLRPGAGVLHDAAHELRPGARGDGQGGDGPVRRGVSGGPAREGQLDGGRRAVGEDVTHLIVIPALVCAHSRANAPKGKRESRRPMAG